MDRCNDKRSSLSNDTRNLRSLKEKLSKATLTERAIIMPRCAPGILNQSRASQSQLGAVSSHNSKSVVRRGISGSEALLNLQRTHGNAFVQRLVQRKLAVRRLGDKYEQEADRLAEAVVRKTDTTISLSVISHQRGTWCSPNMCRV